MRENSYRRFSPRARRSSAPASRRRSAHSDVTSDQHAIDKKEQDARKATNWLRLDDEKDLPTPGVEGAFWGEKAGSSFRVIGGMIVDITPAELFELREKLRKENTTYRGLMMRGDRECYVPRPLNSAVETTNLTLPPWAQAAIRMTEREKQVSMMRKITARVASIASKTGREVIGVDFHADTDKLHLELHTLRINKRTKRLIPWKTTTTWHLGAARKKRAGLLDPKSQEATEWLPAADKKHPDTIDMRMSIAIDEEVDRFIRENRLEANVEIQKKAWGKIVKDAAEKRILGKARDLAKHYTKVAGMGLLSAYAIRRSKELFTGQERDRKIAEQLKIASEMDKVS